MEISSNRDFRNRLVANATLGLVSLLWGSSFVNIKIAAAHFGAAQIACYRLTLAALCLLAFGLLRRERWPDDWRILAKLLLTSIFGQILPFLCLAVSGQLTSSTNSAIMMGATPLMTLLIGRFFLADESWTFAKWTALLLGFFGVIIALGQPIGPGGAGLFTGDLAGKLFALLATLGFAIGAILARMTAKDVAPVTNAALTMTISASLLWAYMLLTGTQLGSDQRAAWLAVLILGIVNTALAFSIYYWLIRLAGATFASLNNYLVPVIGLILGHFVLGEAFEITAAIGLLLILSAVFIFSRAI